MGSRHWTSHKPPLGILTCRLATKLERPAALWRCSEMLKAFGGRVPRKRRFSYPCLGENKTLKVKGLNGPSSHFLKKKILISFDCLWSQWQCEGSLLCHVESFPAVHRLPGVTSGKGPTCQCRRHGPWVGKMPWRRAWQPTPVFLPGEAHGQRSLAIVHRGCRDSDMTEVT